MNVTSAVQTVPRVLLVGYVQAARLPLDLAARATGQAGNEQWPPAVAYETLSAKVEGTVGSLLRDEVLVDRSRLRLAALAQRRRAAELSVVAARSRSAADERLERQHEKIADQREEAARRAKEREQAVEAEADKRKQAAAKRAASKQAAANQAQARREKAVARRERQAKARALTQESQALEAAQAALGAESKTAAIGEAIEASAEARKG